MPIYKPQGVHSSSEHKTTQDKYDLNAHVFKNTH